MRPSGSCIALWTPVGIATPIAKVVGMDQSASSGKAQDHCECNRDAQAAGLGHGGGGGGQAGCKCGKQVVI